MKDQTRNSGKALSGLMLQHEGAKTSNRFPCSLTEGELAGSLNRVRAGTDRWVRQEAWLRWSAYPLGGAVRRDCAQDPAFALSSSEMTVGLWPFCILLCIIAPTAQACNYF